MNLWAGTKVLLRIGEEIVWAGPDKVRAAYFRVGYSELSIATLSPGANELVRCEESTC